MIIVTVQSKPHILVTNEHTPCMHEVHGQMWMLWLIHLQKKKIVNLHLSQT